uniref:SKP1-like protein n=2 Tax=Chrysotila carterae TaxID=13221 RepID=A0A7S4F886_CHRCT|mmetsp:Transcript_895/g.1803  ORF Transcript_895/g.1803 Transcript_895/m.1803 type:complete len:147 (+) Transcript_895:68-508(+)
MADESEFGLVKLKSSDEEVFEVPFDLACMSLMVKGALENTSGDEPVSLQKVTSKTMLRVIEYCKYHLSAEKEGRSESEIAAWDKKFIEVDDAVLYDVMMAGNFLEIKGLLHLACKTIADMIRGNPPDWVKERFNIIEVASAPAATA